MLTCLERGTLRQGLSKHVHLSSVAPRISSVALVGAMSQPHKPLSPCWPDNSEAQTCFMWANTHPDKAPLVEEAVKSWGMSHSRPTPTFKNAQLLVWALDCEDTSQIYWRQLHPRQEWQGVKGQTRELTPKFWCCIFVSVTTFVADQTKSGVWWRKSGHKYNSFSLFSPLQKHTHHTSDWQTTACCNELPPLRHLPEHPS